MEFKRLEESLTGRSNNLENQEGASTIDWPAAVRSMSSALDGVSVLRKGANDIASDGVQVCGVRKRLESRTLHMKMVDFVYARFVTNLKLIPSLLL
jgi:hypothetical protein